MKLKHVRDERRNQRLNRSPRAALTAALFFFSLIVALHLGASRLQAATVNIVPGEDIPNVVNSHPSGTTFVIHPGLYRLQKPIIAKDGAVSSARRLALLPQVRVQSS
jgi:hypothetical protein